MSERACKFAVKILQRAWEELAKLIYTYKDYKWGQRRWEIEDVSNLWICYPLEVRENYQHE